MGKLNLKKITIEADQSIEYMNILTPVVELGYEEVETEELFFNWQYFFTKNDKVYAVDDWNYCNTTVYNVTLIEFADFEEAKEADTDLQIKRFLEEFKGIEMTLSELDNAGLEYFGGDGMGCNDEDTYYSSEEESFSFSFGNLNSEFVVEYDFVDKDEDEVLGTTIKVTSVWVV